MIFYNNTTSPSGRPQPRPTPALAAAALSTALAGPAVAQCDPSTLFPQTNPTYGADAGPNSVAIGDFNSDGTPDLVAGTPFGPGGNTVSVLLGNGDGTFQPEQQFFARVESVSTADLDGNGSTDLALATRNAFVYILLGNGDGTFPNVQSYETGFSGFLGSTYDVALGDLDGDGALDIATPGALLDQVSVLYGNGDGTFQTGQFAGNDIGEESFAIEIRDLDDDGIPDIVTANFATDDVSILFGNGDRTFQPELRLGAGNGPRSVAVGDLDADGIPDIVTANVDGGDVSVLRGNGDGTFQTEQRFGAGSEPGSVAVGDLDGDGNLDLATTNGGFFGGGADDVSVLLGNGDGTFQSEQRFGTGIGPRSVAIGDLDANGAADLATANPDSDNVSVLLNQCPPGALSAQPGAEIVDEGVGVTLTVDVDVIVGIPPLTFQWRKDGVPLSDDGRISGSQTDTLTIADTNIGDADSYDVIVTNGIGTDTSKPAVLAIRAGACDGN